MLRFAGRQAVRQVPRLISRPKVSQKFSTVTGSAVEPDWYGVAAGAVCGIALFSFLDDEEMIETKHAAAAHDEIEATKQKVRDLKKRAASISVEKIREIFNAIDTDGNGTIDESELGRALEKMGCGRQHVGVIEKLILDVDQNADGKIDFEEFTTIVKTFQAAAGDDKEEERMGVWAQFLSEVSGNHWMFDNSHDEKIKGLPDNVLVNLAKAGGSVVMLKDNKGFIYKEMNDKAELEFYQLVHEAKKGGKNPDSFLRYLHSERLIPFCKLQGFVKKMTDEECKGLPPNPSGYYKQVGAASVREGTDLHPELEKGVKPVLVMENLIQGMKNPASCDFKLGDQYCGFYPGEPGYDEIQKLVKAGEVLSTEEKAAVLDKWKMYKTGKNTDGLALKNVTNEQLGIKTPMSNKELKSVMKSWRQELNNLEAPVVEMKFRCCGMRVQPKEGDAPAKFEYEPQKTQGYINMTKARNMSEQELSQLAEDFCQGDDELARYFIRRLNDLILWFSNNTHYRFYASSVCLFYDIDDHKKRDMRWLDFAHAHRMIHSDGQTQWERKQEGGETNESVRDALCNITDCLAPVVWKDDTFDRTWDSRPDP
jgi:hypothetical protein